MLKIKTKALTHSHTVTLFDVCGKEAFLKHCGIRGNAGNQHFLLFPQCFYSIKHGFIIYVKFILSSANAFNLDQVKFLSFGTGLRSPRNQDKIDILFVSADLDPIVLHAKAFTYGQV